MDEKIRDATSTILSAIWPQHAVGVEIQVDRHHEEWAMRIFDSAHWVPIDRHGCVATRDPVGLPDAPLATNPDILPVDTTSLSVCWYSHNRLIALATGATTAGITAIAHRRDLRQPRRKRPPPYSPQPTAAPRTELNRTEAVVLLAHSPGQRDSTPTAQLANCKGTQQWSNQSTPNPPANHSPPPCATTPTSSSPSATTPN